MERNDQFGYSLEIYNNSSLPKLVTEPDSLLLEDQRSKKRAVKNTVKNLYCLSS